MSTAPERQPHAVLDPESRERKARKIEALLAPRCPLAGSRVLDVGAGSGVIAARLAKAVGAHGEAWAVDVVDQRVEHEGYGFRMVSDTALPFEDERFDIVLSNHILDHVGGEAEQRRHLAEIHRVLAQGGCCYLAVANRWVVVEPHFRLPFLSWLPPALRTPYVKLAGRGEAYDCNLPTRGELLGLLRASSFEYEDLTTDAMRHFAAMETTGRLVGRLLSTPEWLLRPLRPVIPTMVFLLRKSSSAP